jgi:hypothetical protein
MPTIESNAPPLMAGDWLTRDEFLARWEQHPEIKKAELIGGVVYRAPIGSEHGKSDSNSNYWLTHYSVHTPGTDSASNSTWWMLGDAPQPDAASRIHESCGGQSIDDGKFFHGAPELVVETCHSSSAYDLHQKLKLFAAAGVREYVTVLLREREIRWHRLSGDQYEIATLPTDGVFKSTVFPGLWLDAKAFLDRDILRVLRVLEAGLSSDEHARFVSLLSQHKLS